MPIRTQENQGIVQARLLYTALIKAVLIAWTSGYPIANPHKDVFAVSADKQGIIDALVTYFNAVPGASSNGVLAEYSCIPDVNDDAEQIAPILRSIASLHKAITHSGQTCARRIAGVNEIDTLMNLIAFFNERPIIEVEGSPS